MHGLGEDDPRAAPQGPGSVELAGELLARFAGRTGLDPPSPAPRRYLWTDAFAVCDFLGLHRRTGDARALRLALRLVDQVHAVLGRHRPDDARTGWISGLDEEEGRAHPTRGGLRIGKPLPERGAGEPHDPHLEWDRDGQYFHYLTRWMHALARVAEVAGDARALRWAVELARVAHAGFVRAGPDGRRRIVWKASIDLERALVPSTGQHDALDGLVTFRELEARASAIGGSVPLLAREITELGALCAGADWATADPLGLGGLLGDALVVARGAAEGRAEDLALLDALLRAAAPGLAAFARGGELREPAAHRLAFRELGLAVGLRALPAIARRVEQALERAPAAARPRGLAPALARLRAHEPLAERLEAFWLDPASQRAATWRDHLDINAVTLATALVPDGYLGE